MPDFINTFTNHIGKLKKSMFGTFFTVVIPLYLSFFLINASPIDVNTDTSIYLISKQFFVDTSLMEVRLYLVIPQSELKRKSTTAHYIEYLISIEENGYVVDFRKKIASINNHFFSSTEPVVAEEIFFLKPGSYTLFYSVMSKDDSTLIKEKEEKLVVNGISLISDVLLCQRIYTDTGRASIFKCLPSISGSFSEMDTFFTYYFEVCRVCSNKALRVISLKIRGGEDEPPVLEDYRVITTSFQEIIRMKGTVDTRKFKEGDYRIEIELISDSGKIAEKYVPFQIRKGIEDYCRWVGVSPDSLFMFAEALAPVCTPSEASFIKRIKEKSPEEVCKFIMGVSIRKNPAMPYQFWSAYRENVIYTLKNFSAPSIPGYRTDRGYVLLKYGKPDVIDRSPVEPSTYPYEIWQYYSLQDGQRNVKFVFFTEDEATNNYTLIHSTARGEVYNPRWQLMINRRTFHTINIDEEEAPAHFGGRSKDKFTLPR